jgi:hypothetical protein
MRTGKFQLGTGQLLSAADGKSSISFGYFAVALADEIERPADIRTRFTAGYWSGKPLPGPARIGLPLQGLGGGPASASEILSVTCRRYIRRARTDRFRSPCT